GKIQLHKFGADLKGGQLHEESARRKALHRSVEALRHAELLDRIEHCFSPAGEHIATLFAGNLPPWRIMKLWCLHRVQADWGGGQVASGRIPPMDGPLVAILAAGKPVRGVALASYAPGSSKTLQFAEADQNLAV